MKNKRMKERKTRSYLYGNCITFRAHLEVFIDLANPNRVPKRLKANLTNDRATA